MKISELFAASGYKNLEDKEIINGGPMMGKLVDIDIASDEQLVKVLDLHNQIINDTKHKNKISYKLVIAAIIILIIYMYFRIK